MTHCLIKVSRFYLDGAELTNVLCFLLVTRRSYMFVERENEGGKGGVRKKLQAPGTGHWAEAEVEWERNAVANSDLS